MVNKSEIINTIRDLRLVYDALALFPEDDTLFGLSQEECARIVLFTIDLLRHIRDEKK